MVQTPTQTRRKRSPLIVTLILLGVLVVAFLSVANVLGDIFWFQQLGYVEVLTTQWLAVAVLFLIVFAVMAAPIYLAMYFAYKTRPVYARLNAQLDRYQEILAPIRKALTIAVPLTFGFFAGVSAATSWQGALTWLNRVPAGTKDPEFGLDVSFFFFELPFYHGVVAFLSAVTLISLLLLALTSYLYGGISFSGKEVRIS